MKPYLLCPLFFQIAKQITVLLCRCAMGGMPILRSRQSPVRFSESVRDVNNIQREFLESLVLDFACAAPT